MSPYDLLRHYCDLNELPYHSSRDQVVDYIIAHPTHDINYATPYRRVFNLIQQYVRDEIDLETMMTRGDMNHAHNISNILSKQTDCFIYDSLITITS